METKYVYGEVEVTKRRKLPHWQTNGGVYLVTFRLCDAIPLATLLSLQLSRSRAIDAASDDPAQRRLAEREYQLSIDRVLDESIGGCVLATPLAARIVENALHHFDSDRYDLAAWSVMPNHVHVVFRLLAEHKLADIVRSWKRYTSREINRLDGRSGSLWQEEYFDTLIRSEKHLLTAVAYVFNNPSVAGVSPRWTGRRDEVISMLQGPQGEWTADTRR